MLTLSSTDRPRLEFQFYSFPAVKPLTSYLTSLGLSFIICKMDGIIVRVIGSFTEPLCCLGYRQGREKPLPRETEIA
jgi:hypothetical protein